jgi:peptide methionine sulfoxide reductase msrA/msrB
MLTLRQSLTATLVPLLLVIVAACGMNRSAASEDEAAAVDEAALLKADSLAKATFAGGCFWCMESAFQPASGVKAAVSGFAGGSKPSPSYDAVASGRTDHTETVQVAYDPDVIGYERLLDIYWRNIDPTDAGGQFADRGSQYRPVIFYHNERQKRLARQSKKELAQSGPFEESIVVPIKPLDTFYAASEDYHQDFYKTHPERYKEYYEASGRGPFLRKTWGENDGKNTSAEADERSRMGGEQATAASVQKAALAVSGGGSPPDDWSDYEKPSRDALKKRLTPIQFEVTQRDGTEPAYQNKYYDNKRAGIYVDVVSGEPLFSSTHKFDSDTGWPSFYKPISSKFVVEKEDNSLGMTRTEVRSRYADSHLGHVFDWSRKPEVPTDLRYCINSAALDFIPAGKLEKRGYGEYASLFE